MTEPSWLWCGMKFLTDFMRVLGVGDRRLGASFASHFKWTGYMNDNIQKFIDAIRPAALAVEAETGIPWRFAMIQAAHESRYGQSKLTVEANNLFGVTGDSWQAQGLPVYIIKTQEYAPGSKEPFLISRPFRKYVDWKASLEDWAGLIQRRYPLALAAAKNGDFVSFANALQHEGYATDPKYAVQLIAMSHSLEDIA